MTRHSTVNNYSHNLWHLEMMFRNYDGGFIIVNFVFWESVMVKRLCKFNWPFVHMWLGKDRGGGQMIPMTVV